MLPARYQTQHRRGDSSRADLKYFQSMISDQRQNGGITDVTVFQPEMGEVGLERQVEQVFLTNMFRTTAAIDEHLARVRDSGDLGTDGDESSKVLRIHHNIANRISSSMVKPATRVL